VSRPRRIAPLVAALAALAAPALALPASAAADYHTVIRDCAWDGKLDHKYGHDDLSQALKHLPTDQREYGYCAAEIKSQLLGGGGSSSGGAPGGGGGGAGVGVSTTSGATSSSRADVGSLIRETGRLRGKRPSIGAGGQTIVPAASGLDHVPGAANRLPLSLLLAILAVAALCAAGGIAAAWRRWPTLVRAPLRLIRR
jgi:hypothetical protein